MSERAIFLAALDKAPAERAAFLDEACAGNETLRRGVETLLRLHAAPHQFLEVPAPEQLAAAAPPLKHLGDYQILREVGRGGMGVVYEAQQLSLGRHVAIKVLPGQALLDPRHLARFQREARAAARLHHTNIVPVFGVGEQDGLHYYVMQFIHGPGLDAVLDELRRLRQPGGKQAPAPGDASSPATAVTRDVSAVEAARALLSGELRPPRATGVTTAAGGRAA